MTSSRRRARSAPALLAALLVPAFALASKGGFLDGDRAFARGACVLRRGPSERAPEVARLLPGDELAVQGQDPDALRTLPAGWLPVATTESPSRRIQVGFVRVFELTADEPATPLRRATLRKAIGADLDGLESREAAFAALRDQAIRWRGLPDGGPEGDRLARRLADYMATEITPRALEAIDRLSQLRGTGDPGAEALARRLDKISRSFRP